MLELLDSVAMAMLKKCQSNDDKQDRMLPVLEVQRHIDHKREQRSCLRPCLSLKTIARYRYVANPSLTTQI